MKARLWMTRIAILPLGMAVISGCASLGSDEMSMIPPSANYAPLQAPVYPPLNQPYSPNLLNNSDSRVLNIDRLNVGEANLPYNAPQTQVPNPAPQDFVINEPQNYTQNRDYVPNYVAPIEIVPYDQPLPELPKQESPKIDSPNFMANSNEPNFIPNSPLLAPDNIIELSAVGMGVAPESTISPSQALALAKRAAIIDAYRQIGEKMYGIKINATDTVKDMVMSSSVAKARVEALIKNADIVETIYKDGLCQVTMELKLDGRIWHKILSQNS